MALFKLRGRNISDEGFGAGNVLDTANKSRFTKEGARKLSDDARSAMQIGPGSKNVKNSNVSAATATFGSAISDNTLELQSTIESMDDTVKEAFKSIATSLAKNNPEAALKNIEKLILNVDDETATKLEKILNLGQVRKDLSKPKSKFNEFFGAKQGSGFVDTIKQGFQGKNFWGEKGAFGTGLGIGGDEGRAEISKEKAQESVLRDKQAEGITGLTDTLASDSDSNQKSAPKKTKESEKSESTFSSGIDRETNRTVPLLEEIRDILKDGLGKGVGGAKDGGGMGLGGGLMSALGVGAAYKMSKSVLGAPVRAAKYGLNKVLGFGKTVADRFKPVTAAAGAINPAASAAGAINPAASAADAINPSAADDVVKAADKPVAKASTKFSIKGASTAASIAAKASKKAIRGAIGKSAGKVGLKMIPGIGEIAGAAFALGRLFKGDFRGAAAETVGIFVPSVAGTLAVDVPLMARDVYNSVYGDVDDPMPHDRDMITPGSGYGEKYSEIVNEVTSFLKDTAGLADKNAEMEGEPANAADIEGDPELVTSTPPMQMGPGDVEAYDTQLAQINDSDVSPSIQRSRRRQLDAEFSSNFGGTPQELESRLEDISVTPSVTPNITAETAKPSVSTSPIARVTGDAVENTLLDSGDTTKGGGATTVVNNVTNNNVSQSGEAILVNSTGPRNQRDPIGKVL